MFQITTYFNVENNQAECFSLKDYEAGDQILIYYGIRSNAFFFLNNGFVLYLIKKLLLIV